jgi:L-amino acid N-acyltransferase YncA
MGKTLLIHIDGYEIWKQQGISQEAIDFLESISWGTEGAVYEHKNTAEHFKVISNPYLLSIEENQRMLGTAVFCNPQVKVQGQTFNYYYTRYFASSPEIRGKGVVKKLAVEVMRSIRNDEARKTIFVGFIEKGNRSSYKVTEAAGYKPIATIQTLGFSRFFPKSSKRVDKVVSQEARNEVIHILEKKYSNYALVHFDYIFEMDNYYVIREDGKIIAGCQYHKAHWVVKRMPGLMGKVALNILPRIPLLNRLFNPNRFEFLAIEGIYVEKGKELVLHELIEHLLAHEDLRSALIWMDKRCPIYQRLQQYGNLGIINNFVKDSNVIIMASYQNLSQEEIQRVESLPLYAAAFDYI